MLSDAEVWLIALRNVLIFRNRCQEIMNWTKRTFFLEKFKFENAQTQKEFKQQIICFDHIVKTKVKSADGSWQLALRLHQRLESFLLCNDMSCN